MEKRSTPSLQITDRFGAQAAFASLRLPDGTETTVPAEHAAAIYVNEQPAFRVVCTPALLPQLALGRLLTEGWIASADEVEQIAVCAEGAKVQVYLRHPLPTRRAAAQEVASCCTDNIALGSPVELLPLRPVPGLALQPEWVQTLTAAMHAGLPVVASDVKGHRDLLGDGCGLLYPYDDRAAFQKAVTLLMDSPGEALRLGLAAAGAAERLRLEAVLPQVLEAYGLIVPAETQEPSGSVRT